MRTRSIFTALILFMSFHSVFAQESKWYADGGAKLSVFKFSGEGFNSIDAYTSSSQDYYFVDENSINSDFAYLLFYELGGGYKFNSWLNGHLSVGYASASIAGRGHQPASSGNGGGSVFVGTSSFIQSSYTVENRGWEVVPSVRFDLIPKDEYADFSFILGVGYGLIISESVASAEGTDEMDNPVNQQRTWTRHIDYLKLNLGVEWRDYFSPHFGYFLRLHAYPGLLAGTSTIDVQTFTVDGTVQPLQGEEIKPGENDNPEEKHNILFTELALGLTYQF